MDELIKGYHRFRSGTWAHARSRFEELSKSGQRPQTMLIACSDSRADPAMIFETPDARWAARHDFALPEDWSRLAFAIAAPLDATITIDGTPLGALERVGQSTYGALRVDTTPGVHRVECTPACGVSVWGWDSGAGFALGGATRKAETPE